VESKRCKDSKRWHTTRNAKETNQVEIWPAIDLLGGKCVRLQQGDYARDTIFSDRPGEIASRWFDAGSQLLHCVDLDGAKTGSIVNEPAIRQIVDASQGKPVQLGGGVRDEATIKRLLGLGLQRLVVGTAALKDPKWFASMCERFPGHMVLGVDARDGMVATEGWLETSTTPATELIQRIGEHTQACVAVVYTDISRDGMLEGPNLESLAVVQACSPFPVIASGGVTTLKDVEDLIRQKTHGAIIGRALYEGRLDLKEVLKRA
jgi:phosphoribosylformimino-5-aminoimidazole carboxamide ribotide isomerase